MQARALLAALALALATVTTVLWIAASKQERVFAQLIPIERPKGRQLRDAGILFAELHKGWRMEWAPQADAPAALAKLTSFVRTIPRLELFTPADSALTLEIARELADLSRELGRPLWGQVIASDKVHERVPLRSVFLSARQYLRGLENQLARLGMAGTRPVWIFVEAGHPYLTEAARAAEDSLGARGFGNRKVITYPSRGLVPAWRASKAPKNAVLVFVVLNLEEAGGLRTDASLRGHPRVFTYGHFSRPEALEPVIAPVEGEAPELHAIFWNPFVELGTSTHSSCAFTENFIRRFGYLPDFHAAFLYATLEAMSASGAEPESITGALRFSGEGRRDNFAPLFLEFGSGQPLLLGGRHACESPAAREYFLKVKYAPGP